MAERTNDHAYQDALREKIEQYFAPMPGTNNPDFRIDDLYDEHPDLPMDIGFIRDILATAETIRRGLEQYDGLVRNVLAAAEEAAANLNEKNPTRRNFS